MSDDKPKGLMANIRYYWNESLARHVYVQREDHIPLDLPLLVVIIAAAIAPWLVAGGVIVALLMGYELHMRRDEPADEAPATSESEATPPEAPAPPPGPAPAPDASTAGGESPPPGEPTEPPPPRE